MGVLFSLFLLFAYGLIFNTVQSNSVAHALRYTFSCPEWLTGSVLALFVLLAISAGLRGVARLMQWLVPIMALLWVAASLVVAALHFEQVPGVIASIFKSLWLARSRIRRAGLYPEPGIDGRFSTGHVLQ